MVTMSRSSGIGANLAPYGWGKMTSENHPNSAEGDAWVESLC